MMTMIYGGSSITFTDSSIQNTAATGFGFKNRIINGAMMIDQRNAGVSQTINTAGVYTVDRMYAFTVGANATGQRVAGSGNNQYNYQITGAASVTSVHFGQKIESYNSYDMAGTTATLSVNLANSLLTTVTWVAYYAGATDNWGVAATQIATGTFTVNSTLTQYTTQISIPAAATTGVWIDLSVGAQTSGTWTIGKLQLEKGSTATSFDYRPYGTEVALCQRYYNKSYSIDVVPGTNTSAGSQRTISSAGACVINFTYPVEMRPTPTITPYSVAGTSGVFGSDAGNWTPTATNPSTRGFGAYGAITSGVWVYGHYVASSEL